MDDPGVLTDDERREFVDEATAFLDAHAERRPGNAVSGAVWARAPRSA